jgi:hypothetical protein
VIRSNVEPQKQTYVSPRLVTYGDVAQLTQNQATGGKNDKGSGAQTRTR